ncbi:MAG: hypothetical protein ACQKBT_13145 [Puniceicoccales bacterium]
MKNWKRLVLAFVLLLAGFGFGFGSATMIAVYRLKSALPLDEERIVKVAERFLDRRLELDKNQRAAVRPALKTFAGELIALRQKIAPEAMLALEEMIDQMEPQLSGVQMAKLNQLMVKFQANWEPETSE